MQKIKTMRNTGPRKKTGCFQALVKGEHFMVLISQSNESIVGDKGKQIYVEGKTVQTQSQ
jgi:hypothetical protein